ncbi:MAG: hypothetical protein HY906_08075 [Deltaproteobacteria bacterium]|nr:hypothetical protein [Deltaproteobacteria bacterium]
MRRNLRRLVLSPGGGLAVLLLLLAGCGGEAPTAARVIVTFDGLEVDQLRIEGLVEDVARFSLDVPVRAGPALTSGADVVVIFGDSFGEPEVEFVVGGFQGGQQVGVGSSRVRLQRQQLVTVAVALAASAPCPSGAHDCGGACYLDDDVDHCGLGCVACPAAPAHGHPTCAGGSCRLSCDAGYVECPDACADLASDGANCGRCGHPCGAGEVCQQGECQTTPCPAGQQWCDGQCVSSFDVSRCGTCTTVCPGPVSGAATGSPACTAGTCELTCNPGTATTCSPANGGKACVDAQTDPQFCGTCTTQCPAGQTCAGGSCTSVCAPGMSACPYVGCVNLTSDGGSCNGCTSGCSFAGDNKCDHGACASSCSGGRTQCGSYPPYSCADLQRDPAHCGTCSRKCADSEICVGGSCATFIWASGCWECGNGNPYSTCCVVAGKTVCKQAAGCP